MITLINNVHYANYRVQGYALWQMLWFNTDKPAGVRQQQRDQIRQVSRLSFLKQRVGIERQVCRWLFRQTQSRCDFMVKILPMDAQQHQPGVSYFGQKPMGFSMTYSSFSSQKKAEDHMGCWDLKIGKPQSLNHHLEKVASWLWTQTLTFTGAKTFILLNH